ncbi:uncharacterized protein YpmB [Salirhabdus euzebyi]|uniref:Uncharacterized protein YpmB n=1 Tax=Salirhabdus euzebyi TaxID=394506 RepID=A0A841Q133_9BACI|nr:hypothetical protein [Salirhabdus euzebyi]MBB6451703.1 uncharacterized protein YpmB [Salirhabdus euzebyi]
MKKWQITAIIIVFFILFVLIYFEDTNKSFFNQTQLDEVSSWEEVKEYQYENTPGLKRAEKLGLAKTFDYLTYEIPGTEKEISIDEVWYSDQQVYLFYSYDIDESMIEDMESNQERQSQTVQFAPTISESNDVINHGIYTGNWPNDTGVIYDGKLYQRLIFSPFFDNSVEHHLVERIPEFVLKNFRIHIEGETRGIGDITYSY